MNVVIMVMLLEFYLSKSRSLVEFMPLKFDENTFAPTKVATGFKLVFCLFANMVHVILLEKTKPYLFNWLLCVM